MPFALWGRSLCRLPRTLFIDVYITRLALCTSEYLNHFPKLYSLLRCQAFGVTLSTFVSVTAVSICSNSDFLH